MRASVARAAARGAARRADRVGRATVLLVLSLGALVMSAPFLWLLTSALKDPANIWLFPPQWVPSPVRWRNFSEALTSAPFPIYARNTLVIVLGNEVGVLLSASLAAYGFARLRFPGRDAIFMLLLSTIMLPWAVVMVPNYIMFRQLGWLDTPLPVMFPESFMISARAPDREVTVMSPEWSLIVARPEIRVALMSPESVLRVTVPARPRAARSPDALEISDLPSGGRATV